MAVAPLLAPMDSPTRAGLELVAVVALLEAELWSLRAWAPAWLHAGVYALLAGTMLASLARHRAGAGGEHDAPRVGRGRAWGEAFGVALVLGLVLAGAAAGLGDRNETFEFVFLSKPPGKLTVWLVGKFLAALGQQLALMLFLWPNCRELTRGRTLGTILAAAIFGLVHLPSPTLVAITLVAGLAWIALFRRGGRLAPLVAVHMALATLAHGALPERLTCDMRVGRMAVDDGERFARLDDPKARQINRRLKDYRDDLRYFSSAEYYARAGGTDASFVRGLHRDILARAATDADVAFWLSQPFPDRRVQVPSIFLASDEFAHLQASRRAAGRSTALGR